VERAIGRKARAVSTSSKPFKRPPMGGPARQPFKRTSGYGCGGKYAATGNLAKPRPARAPWLR